MIPRGTSLWKKASGEVSPPPPPLLVSGAGGGLDAAVRMSGTLAVVAARWCRYWPFGYCARAVTADVVARRVHIAELDEVGEMDDWDRGISRDDDESVSSRGSEVPTGSAGACARGTSHDSLRRCCPPRRGLRGGEDAGDEEAAPGSESPPAERKIEGALTDAVTALSLALWAWTALEPAQAAIGALDMVVVALARTICLVLVGRGYVTAAPPASVCLTSLVYALGKTVALASVPGALDGPATAPFLVHAIIAPVLEWTVSATAHATGAVAHWPAALRRASRSALAETGDLAATPVPAPSARLTSGRGTARGKSGRGKRTPSSKRPLLASDEFNSLEYRTFLGAAGPSNAPAPPPSDDDQPARRARSFTFSGKPTTGGAAPDTPWLATSPPPAVPRPRPRPANRPPPNKNPNRCSFFALVALLFSSLIWYALPGRAESLQFGYESPVGTQAIAIVIAVLSQELVRWGSGF
ncbi:hypothetical protein AMAG_09659 [Allomyces macrogynus ATCC 38327]|uniref:Uncharacterized protein n=1 Tax=Allomyces macrogynus (strain ATCC 38327) TaxID=578462 RepID=A0A0L0STE6_ALLM3|nr:hypothetical protein AMAG_09659 [Allomyces macrogynus ATCC 38327]|eukprot:KNE65675.1 hypothetical protein AMAG_09659 [Allomyces macrogynus ATCC 38327]